MEKMKVLFGFGDESFEGAVKALLKQKGYEAEIFARFNKESVKQFVEKNPDTAAVVLLEAFPRQSRGAKPQKYTAEEVAQLTEGSDVNVILVLSENYKGTDYMRTLFAAGITSAFLQKRNEGARPRDIAGLILQKRTRKMAREYYGIGSGKIEFGFLESDDFNGLYEKMHAQPNMLAGYLAVCGNLNAQQIADFTRRLPEDDREYLAGFEEFHTVVALVNKFGIELKVKRPRKVVIGLNKNVAIGMKDGKVVFESGESGESAKEPVKEEPTAVVEEMEEVKEEIKEEVKEEVVPSEPTPEEKEEDTDEYSGMDLASLIALATGNNGPSEKKAVETSVVESVKEETVASIQEKQEVVIEESNVEIPKEEEPKVEPIKEPVIKETIKEKPKKEEVKEEPKVTYVKPSSNFDEEEGTPIVFDDDEYDDVILGKSGSKKSPVYILVMLIFVALIGVLYYYSR